MKIKICPRCGRENDRISSVYCSECLKYQKESREMHKRFGVCTVCGKENVYRKNGSLCDSCLEKKRIYNSLRYAEHKEEILRIQSQRSCLKYKADVANGICTRCGKFKAAPLRKKCRMCLSKDAEHHRLKRWEREEMENAEKRKETVKEGY